MKIATSTPVLAGPGLDHVSPGHIPTDPLNDLRCDLGIRRIANSPLASNEADDGEEKERHPEELDHRHQHEHADSDSPERGGLVDGARRNGRLRADEVGVCGGVEGVGAVGNDHARTIENRTAARPSRWVRPMTPSGLPRSRDTGASVSSGNAGKRKHVSADTPVRGAVLEVCHYWGPYPGNFIPSLVATRSAVRERLDLGYHCVFPAAMQGRPWVQLLQDEGVPHSFITPSHRVGLVGQIGRVAESTDAVLLRSHFSNWDIEAGAAARRRKAVSVWHMHSGRFGRAPNFRSRTRDALKVRGLGRLCDRVFAVSDEVHRLAAARGFPERKISTVLNGIDVRRFDHLPSRREARTALGLDTDIPIALGFGWSPYTKGTDVLVEAGRSLGEAGELVVVLVGDRSLEARFGGADVDWLRVIEPRDDVGTIFAAADIFVSSSRDEGLPYSIGEAMASRLPVISSDIKGPATYFAADGVVTFPSEDTTALGAALEELLQVSDRRSLGLANRDYVEQHLGIDAHVNRVVELFEQLLARRGT